MDKCGIVLGFWCIYCLHFVDYLHEISWYHCIAFDCSSFLPIFMPNTTPMYNRSIRKNGHRPASRPAIALATITVEQVLYEIALLNSTKWILGQRQGHSWYNEDGEHLAEAAQIKAIRIPARRY